MVQNEIMLKRKDLEKLLELLEELDHTNHWDRGTGVYKEDEMIARLQKYLTVELEK